MSEKVPCTQCGAQILATTAARTNGLCMPCKGGYRKSLEENKRRAIEEREADRTDPFRALWRSLVNRVYNLPGGFESLSEAEKLYFAVGVLEGEVYNGGFDQYFFNSSGADYLYAEKGLLAVGAAEALELLRQAKELLFPTTVVPVDTKTRRQILRDDLEGKRSGQLDPKLDALNRDFWTDPDKLEARMQAFAREHGLVP